MSIDLTTPPAAGASKAEVKEYIEACLAQADSALEAAAACGRAHGQYFSWSGPAYGMGGSFDPSYTEDEYGNESDGWYSSSQGC